MNPVERAKMWADMVNSPNRWWELALQVHKNADRSGVFSKEQMDRMMKGVQDFVDNMDPNDLVIIQFEDIPFED